MEQEPQETINPKKVLNAVDKVLEYIDTLELNALEKKRVIRALHIVTC